jgi:hypothetical protein
VERHRGHVDEGEVGRGGRESKETLHGQTVIDDSNVECNTPLFILHHRQIPHLSFSLTLDFGRNSLWLISS